MDAPRPERRRGTPALADRAFRVAGNGHRERGDDNPALGAATNPWPALPQVNASGGDPDAPGGRAGPCRTCRLIRIRQRPDS